MSPRDMTVACFPGHECLEITEVYDQLRIPRENITCMERHPTTARQIRNKLKGVNVVQGDAQNFFEATDEKFTIINLDYQGQLGCEERDTVSSICERQILKRCGILGTNFYGSRESDTRQSEYRHHANLQKNGAMHIQQKMQEFGLNVDFGSIGDRQELSVARSDGISQAVLRTIFSQGPGFFFREAMELTLKAYTTLSKDQYCSLEPMTPSLLKDVSHSPAFLSLLLPVYIKAMRQLPELRSLDDTTLTETLTYFMMEHEKPYLVEQHARYLYRTDANQAPLFCDFFYLSRHWYRWENNYLSFAVQNDEIKIHRRSESIRQLLKTAKKFIEGPVRSYLPQFMPPRTSLEQIANEETTPLKDRLNKSDAVTLLESGCSPTEIADVYDGFSVGQLRALKAHVTMGTYKTRTMPA